MSSGARRLAFLLGRASTWRSTKDRLAVDLSSTALDELIAFCDGTALRFTSKALPGLVLELVANA